MATVDGPQLSESQYAHHRKELLALMSQLRSVGAQGELDLPRISVIGNQSAGKSSVVEAISGIKVPRDAGTCTRCPMECRMTSSTSLWSCKISIRVEFDTSGRPQEVKEHQFGDVIMNKDEVELALRRAQVAVLNPHLNFGSVLKMNAQELKDGIPGTTPLPFSRNVICVDLEGPDLTDLIFLDLPGIIQNAEPETVQLVEEMVVSHIRGNNCLILCALPMTDDIENQKALRLARQEDPECRRTIGVLTKPDLLSTGSKVRDLWLDVIEGRKHVLHHGYYCTRQPDDDERSRNISSTQARRAENEFFAETAPWSTSTQRDRFGTENLVSTLSTLLVQIINDRLPFIRQMASERMDECRRDLAAIPEKVVGEPATHMLNLLTAFCTEIRHYVDGQSDTSALIHERNEAFANFKTAINKTQPHFVARVPGQAGDATYPIQIDDDPAPSATELISQNKTVYLTDIRTHLAKSITRELPGNIPFSAKKSLITAFQSTWLDCAAHCFNLVKHSMLALLMRCIGEKFGRYELLQARLTTCITDLAARYYDTCGSFLMAMLEVEKMPFTQNDHYLSASTEKWLSRYKDERAGKKRSSAGEEPASKRRKLTENQPSASTSRSSDPSKFGAPAASTANPFGSFGTAPPPKASSRELSVFKPLGDGSSSRDHSPVMTDPEKINNVLAQLAELGYPGVSPEDFGKLRQVDEYETEITVMSEVRGYFQCAYKRLIDVIPSLIDLKFLRAISEALQQELISEFELGGANANTLCAEYLAEDPRLVAKREDLTARRRRLEAIQIQLHNFGLNRGAAQA